MDSYYGSGRHNWWTPPPQVRSWVEKYEGKLYHVRFRYSDDVNDVWTLAAEPERRG